MVPANPTTVVFSPQIIENWKRSSAEGLSVVFIIIWLLGDFFNIIGAVLQGVLPTMIILAVYYTLADIVLLLQCFWYKGFTLRDDFKKPLAESDEAVERTLVFNGSSQQITCGTYTFWVDRLVVGIEWAWDAWRQF